MSTNDVKKRKLLLVYCTAAPQAAGDALDLSRLKAALRARGAEIEECLLGADPDALLDRLESGAVPVLLRSR